MQGLEAALKRKDADASIFLAPEEPAGRRLLAARAGQGNRRGDRLRLCWSAQAASAPGRSSNITKRSTDA